MYGKIATISKSGDTTLAYTYDAGGNRISKSVIHGVDTLTTWYVRDAQGNVLSVYTYGDPAVHGKDLTQTEAHVYGSSRLGILKLDRNVERDVPVTTSNLHLLGVADSVIFSRGNKLFELTNHLGNVLVTISDKRYGVRTTTDTTAGYFIPDVVSANDYYPFGSMQPGRSYAQSGDAYRYGFNGKENDNEVKGEGNEIDYGMRAYDPRAGRFLSVDPLTRKYPELTPFQYASNRPVDGVDQDGMEYLGIKEAYIDISIQYEPKLKSITAVSVFINMENINPPTREAVNSRPVSRCENCFVAEGGSALIGRIAYKSPIIKNVQDADMNDVPTPTSLTSSAIRTLVVPSNAKAVREQLKTRKFENVSSDPAPAGGTKIDILMGVIQLETWALQHKIAEIVKDDLKMAEEQTLKFTTPVATDINFALAKKIIPTSMLNDEDLSAFANYLLYGKAPVKGYALKNSKDEEYFPVDYKKLEHFERLDAQLQKAKADASNSSSSTNSSSNSSTVQNKRN